MTAAMKEAGLGDSSRLTDTPYKGIYHPYSLHNADGGRDSAASLLPTSQDPSFSNLTVKTDILVTRILFDSNQPEPRAIGVEFKDLSTESTATQVLMQPHADFFLSSGTIHTPKLLMMSGIGDTEELQKYQIPVLKHNPHVGKHLKDKPVVAISVSSRIPIGFSVGDTMAMTDDFLIGTLSGGATASLLTSATLAMVPKKNRSALLRRLVRGLFDSLPNSLRTKLNQQFSVYAILTNPISEGSISLSSSDAHADPHIDTPGFNHPEEIASMTRALRVLRDIVNSAAFQRYRRDAPDSSSYSLVRATGKLYALFTGQGDRKMHPSTPVSFPVLPELNQLDFNDNDSSSTQSYDEKMPQPEETAAQKEARVWIQTFHAEGWTYTSTCRVGDVVDTDFNVLGVRGLKIVDASVLKRPSRVNAQATMMMLGAYVGNAVVKAAA